jgi:hypothetical protein
MKNIFTTVLLVATSAITQAQNGVLDSVFLGPGYSNEVYYNTQSKAKQLYQKTTGNLVFRTI